MVKRRENVGEGKSARSNDEVVHGGEGALSTMHPRLPKDMDPPLPLPRVSREINIRWWPRHEYTTRPCGVTPIYPLRARTRVFTLNTNIIYNFRT